MELGHIGIGVKDLQKTKEFYDSIIEFLDLEYLDHGEHSVRYGKDGSALLFFSINMNPVSGVHLCFDVENQEDVDNFYNAAIKSGGTDNGKPGIREHYSPSYYAAFVFDPDGNNIEAVCRD